MEASQIMPNRLMAARIDFRKVSEEVYFATGCDREATFLQQCDAR